MVTCSTPSSVAGSPSAAPQKVLHQISRFEQNNAPLITSCRLQLFRVKRLNTWLYNLLRILPGYQANEILVLTTCSNGHSANFRYSHGLSPQPTFTKFLADHSVGKLSRLNASESPGAACCATCLAARASPLIRSGGTFGGSTSGTTASLGACFRA